MAEGEEAAGVCAFFRHWPVGAAAMWSTRWEPKRSSSSDVVDGEGGGGGCNKLHLLDKPFLSPSFTEEDELELGAALAPPQKKRSRPTSTSSKRGAPTLSMSLCAKSVDFWKNYWLHT